MRLKLLLLVCLFQIITDVGAHPSCKRCEVEIGSPFGNKHSLEYVQSLPLQGNEHKIQKRKPKDSEYHSYARHNSLEHDFDETEEDERTNAFTGERYELEEEPDNFQKIGDSESFLRRTSNSKESVNGGPGKKRRKYLQKVYKSRYGSQIFEQGQSEFAFGKKRHKHTHVMQKINDPLGRVYDETSCETSEYEYSQDPNRVPIIPSLDEVQTHQGRENSAEQTIDETKPELFWQRDFRKIRRPSKYKDSEGSYEFSTGDNEDDVLEEPTTSQEIRLNDLTTADQEENEPSGRFLEIDSLSELPNMTTNANFITEKLTTDAPETIRANLSSDTFNNQVDNGDTQKLEITDSFSTLENETQESISGIEESVQELQENGSRGLGDLPFSNVSTDMDQVQTELTLPDIGITALPDSTLENITTLSLNSSEKPLNLSFEDQDVNGQRLENMTNNEMKVSPDNHENETTEMLPSREETPPTDNSPVGEKNKEKGMNLTSDYTLIPSAMETFPLDTNETSRSATNLESITKGRNEPTSIMIPSFNEGIPYRHQKIRPYREDADQDILRPIEERRTSRRGTKHGTQIKNRPMKHDRHSRTKKINAENSGKYSNDDNIYYQQPSRRRGRKHMNNFMDF